MRRRTTCILDANSFLPTYIDDENNPLEACSLAAVKEDRLTFGAAELPEDV